MGSTELEIGAQHVQVGLLHLLHTLPLVDGRSVCEMHKAKKSYNMIQWNLVYQMSSDIQSTLPKTNLLGLKK